ncbi:hypothetical protein VOI54_16845 [Tamlana sp. 2201CG12-4]|uniref:hypothetical protein n=1 Tax=Tamlana sp. 2201CG12-4 TaxID=3112582 RepID=UPI002DBC9C5A|nr:hypothetical protein [Tamlana sp. 2201CG12-4]MEC3908698.1 hypothetical protein [Tamlana sp. 2201CG12-4]
MKRLLYVLFLVYGMTFASADTPITPNNTDPKIGDVLKIKTPKRVSFKHIDFPRLNFIVKRGSIASYKSVHEELVVVKEVNDDNGDIHVILERKDGKKFFGYLKQVKANYTESIEAGEIIKVES